MIKTDITKTIKSLDRIAQNISDLTSGPKRVRELVITDIVSVAKSQMLSTYRSTKGSKNTHTPTTGLLEEILMSPAVVDDQGNKMTIYLVDPMMIEGAISRGGNYMMIQELGWKQAYIDKQPYLFTPYVWTKAKQHQDALTGKFAPKGKLVAIKKTEASRYKIYEPGKRTRSETQYVLWIKVKHNPWEGRHFLRSGMEAIKTTDVRLARKIIDNLTNVTGRGVFFQR